MSFMVKNQNTIITKLVVENFGGGALKRAQGQGKSLVLCVLLFREKSSVVK